MNEVTQSNFETLLPQIKATFTDADFISFDCEFTGIPAASIKGSFSDVRTRYLSVCKEIDSYVTIQIGLTAFKHTLSGNRFDAQSYKFYLMPRTLPGENRRFEWQVASLEFLAAQKFDFNKVVHNGISYMNNCEEASLMSQLEQNKLQYNVQNVSADDEDIIKNCIYRIGKWYNSYSADLYKVETSNNTIQYLVHKEVRNTFPCVWTISANKAVIVMKTTSNLHNILRMLEGAALEEALIDSYIGFSKLFKHICSLKKPVIGHNVLLDLMFMYKQFYVPLPDYDIFTKNILELFPAIYDTKYIFSAFHKELHQSVHSRESSLRDIYKFTRSSYNNDIMSSSPLIVLDDSTEINVQFHDAGWDSFCAGYIFIKMAYMYAATQSQVSTKNNEPPSFDILLKAVKRFENIIFNSNYKHIELDAVKPCPTNVNGLNKSTKQSNDNTGNLVLGKLGILQNTMPSTQKHNLSTVANNTSVSNILKRFNHGRGAHVAQCKPMKNVIARRFPLWTRIAVSTGAFVWTTHRTFLNAINCS